jgi:hypothetical protein
MASAPAALPAARESGVGSVLIALNRTPDSTACAIIGSALCLISVRLRRRRD